MTLTLPNRLVIHLLVACVATFGAYVVLMVVTICFATWQTELSAAISTREAAIVTLETQYYDAISQLSKSDPAALGYVTPSHVEYVAANGQPTFTRADQ